MDEKDAKKGTSPLISTPDMPASSRTTINFLAPESIVGKCLDGRFLIEKNLTEGGADTGGIGVVFLAKDLKLMDKEVVVKILNEKAVQHPDIVRKFKHEKEALIRLDHPGIVRILDSGELEDGNPFMVMDFIQGHSLRKAMKEAGRLPLDVCASIIEAIGDALSCAHGEKVLHRDIKPENIMLTPIDEGFYRVRIIDFGIARVGDSQLAPETQISRAIGSVLYIAPEQLIGDLDLTPAADIFSLGIVAYEMITGELPYKPKAIAEMYQLEREGVKVMPTELRPELPREAETVLMSALQFDANLRPQNARAFARYLAHELLLDSGDASDRFFSSIKTEFGRTPTTPIPTIDPLDLQTAQKSNPTLDRSVEKDVPSEKPSSRRGMWVAAAAGLVALLAIPAIYFGLFSGGRTPPANATNTANINAVPSADSVELTYWLMVQKMRDGKPFEEPFKSSGQEIFESGYKFKMTFQAGANGSIYVFNVGKNAAGKNDYSLLFPSPNVNGGNAALVSGQTVETASNTFSGGHGTEVMWLVWKKNPDPELDKAVKSATPPAGIIAAPESIATLENYISKYAADKVMMTKDTANQRTVVKGSGDTVVYRFELEHR